MGRSRGVWLTYSKIFKMAFDLGRILALSLFFLAAISIEQTKSQENSTNTEVDTEYDQDVLFDVPENPNEKFNQSFYLKAQSYTASNWRKMTAGDVDDFSQYSNKLEAGIRKKMAEVLGLENDPNLSTDDMAKIFQEKSDKGEVTSAELSTLRTYTMAMQEAYVKRVIEVFNLKPEDLGTNPQYFCEVFEFCEFLSSTTSTTSTTTTTRTTTITTASTTTKTTSTIPLAGDEPLSSTSSSTTPKTTSVSETTAKTTEITIPTNSVKTTSKIPADRIEVLPVVNLTKIESDLGELESKVEASGDEDSEASGTEAPLEQIAGRRSDNLNPGIVFDGTDESEQEVEARIPKVKASTGSETDSEPETDGEPGWGSGSSRTNSDITSKALLCCLILTLSHLL